MKVIILLTIIIFSVNCQQFKSNTRNYRRLPSEELTLAESPSYYLYEPNGPGTYAFGYEVDDPSSGNVQFRDEEKLENGTIIGTYGYMRPDGLVSLTTYTADANGFRTKTQNFKRAEKPPKSDLPIPHPLDTMMNDDNEMPSSENSVSSEKPSMMMMSQNGKKNGLGFQLINNFIPTNFPIIPFNPPEKEMTTKQENADHDFVDLDNDKFFNPLTNKEKNSMLRKISKISNDLRQLAETKEALWYKELIRSRRREFLKKYANRGQGQY